MRRNLESLKAPRKPYSVLSFPEWVTVTYCTTQSRTVLVPVAHGNRKLIVMVEGL